MNAKHSIDNALTPLPDFESLEVVDITVTTLRDPLTICAAYKPQETPICTADLRKLRRIGGHVLVLGDLKAKRTVWISTGVNAKGRKLLTYAETVPNKLWNCLKQRSKPELPAH